MPTTLPRLTISAFPEVADALATARKTWPDAKSDTELVYRLLGEGAIRIQEKVSVQSDSRRMAIENLAQEFAFPIQNGRTWLHNARDEDA